MTSSVRRVTLTAAALLVAPLLASAPADAGPTRERVDQAQQAAPTYDATVRITQHGIPHIVADDWASLGYGSGYADGAPPRSATSPTRC